MKEIISITQTKSNVRIFCLNSRSFFIEDWNKILYDTANKNLEKK